MRATFSRAILFSIVGALVFSSGIVLGQEMANRRVEKYLVRSQATELDHQFLNMQIEEIQSALDVLGQIETPERTGVPAFHLNPNIGKIQVLVSVHGNWVDKVPFDEVQQALKSQAQEIIRNLKFHMREISDADVFISFAKTNVVTNEIVNNFAEYRDGVLTIRH